MGCNPKCQKLKGQYALGSARPLMKAVSNNKYPKEYVHPQCEECLIAEYGRIPEVIELVKKAAGEYEATKSDRDLWARVDAMLKKLS